MPDLTGKKVAIVATDGFERAELVEPLNALKGAGAEVEIVSLKEGKIRSWSHDEWGDSQTVDQTVDAVSCEDYDALMLPGGVINADNLRKEQRVVDFVRDFAESGKPIAAICHAAWTLIETGAVSGRTLTSWPSLKSDLKNAGAVWVDKEVVADRGWVTSRKPDDLPAFNKCMLEQFTTLYHAPPQKFIY